MQIVTEGGIPTWSDPESIVIPPACMSKMMTIIIFSVCVHVRSWESYFTVDLSSFQKIILQLCCQVLNFRVISFPLSLSLSPLPSPSLPPPSPLSSSLTASNNNSGPPTLPIVLGIVCAFVVALIAAIFIVVCCIYNNKRKYRVIHTHTHTHTSLSHTHTHTHTHTQSHTHHSHTHTHTHTHTETPAFITLYIITASCKQVS